MKLLIYIVICISAALFQTTVQPLFPLNFSFYDPMLFFILYLAQKTGIVEGVFFTLVAGILVDGLSEGGAGFYLASYTWFFFVIRGFSLYLRAGTSAVSVLMIMAGILLQNSVFFLPELAGENPFYLLDAYLAILRSQLVWAFFTAAFFYTVFLKFMSRYSGYSRILLLNGHSSDDSDLFRI